MVKTQAVRLSRFKFAGLRPPRDLESNVSRDPPQKAENTFPTIEPQNPRSPSAKSCTASHQSPSTAAGLKPYERIAAEKPGEELAPDAVIWEMYVEEAKEQDAELVGGKNGNLDQMLLFATLFSAILTAFIIESKDLLQQDSAELTVTLLLAIAQSQQRVEQGTPQTLPPVELPPFSAPMSARWINGLWYTALGLSLSAALVAMLAKEWLSSFLASRPRAPQAYALKRQTRLEGFTRWKALHIIDLLPAMLHLSLLLFSLGLTIYLKTIDSGAAITVVIITVTTALFYLGTALLGARSEACPFHTQFSKYLRILLDQISTSNRALRSSEIGVDTESGNYTSDDELGALIWLAKNARDPTVEDCAYQALAGLRISQVSPTESPHQPVLHEGPNKSVLVTSLPARYTLLASLFDAISFAALDSIWSNDCPELHPDSYAMLASADLRVIGLTTLAQHSNQDASTTRITMQHGKSTSESLLQHSAIQIDCSLDSQSISDTEFVEEADGLVKIPLIELRARYSRTLFRVSLCLSFHNNGRAPIGPYPLAHLLDSIYVLSQYTDINPANCLSTHQPQAEDVDMLPVFGANVVGTGQSYHVSPLVVGDEDGLLAGLVGVLSTADIEVAPELEYAAGRALASVGPMLFRQWLQTEDDKLKKYLQDQPGVLERVNSVLDSWPIAFGVGNLTLLPEWTVSQLLAVAAIACALDGGPYGGNLLQATASALSRRANTADGRNGIRTAVQKAPLIVHNLVLVMEENHRHLNQATYDSLLRLFLIKPWTGRSIFRDRAVPLTCLPYFLRCLCNWPGNVSKVQAILGELRELLQEDLGKRRTCEGYISSFLWLSEGFASLVSLSQVPEYTTIMVECIKSVVHFALENPRTYPLCRGALSCVIPGLLDCVSVVLMNAARDIEQVLPMQIFLRDVVALIDGVDAEGVIIAADHAVMSNIEAVLAEPHESFEGFVDLVAAFERIRARAALYEWLMGMRNWFSDEAEPGKFASSDPYDDNDNVCYGDHEGYRPEGSSLGFWSGTAILLAGSAVALYKSTPPAQSPKKSLNSSTQVPTVPPNRAKQASDILPVISKRRSDA
ncbi:hypothetical protein FRC07_002166, partial [Ceratobasidium sp. 392]